MAIIPGFSFLGSFYVVVYFVTDACLLCCVLFVYQYRDLAKRLAGKNASQMNYIVPGGT